MKLEIRRPNPVFCLDVVSQQGECKHQFDFIYGKESPRTCVRRPNTLRRTMHVVRGQSISTPAMCLKNDVSHSLPPFLSIY